MKPFSQSRFTNGTKNFDLTHFAPTRFSTPAIQPMNRFKPPVGTVMEATPINNKATTTATVVQSVFSPLNESENTPPLQTIVEDRNMTIKENNSNCKFSTNQKIQDPVGRVSSMLKRPPSPDFNDRNNSSGTYNVALIQCSVSTQTDVVLIDYSTSNNVRYTQPDYVRPVIEECFEELEDRMKPPFYNFCSQILTLLHEQSDKIDLINRQSVFVEQLMQENKELRKRLDRLEAIRFGY